MTRFTTLYPSFVGFDQLFHDLERLAEGQTQRTSTYPPHNVLKVDDNRYVVEMAVAGFSRDEIEITTQDSNLTIKGEKSDSKPDVVYIHRGIGNRSFTKSLTLADTIEVRGAEFKDGILRIALEDVVPDAKKPRRIEIGESLALPVSKQQLLNETV